MRFTSVKHISRVIILLQLFLAIFAVYIFVPTYGAPFDSVNLSPEQHRISSSTSKKSDDEIKVDAGGISYRLDVWSQYENPEEGIEREGDIHEFPESRKTTTRDQNLLWPKGVVKYWIHSSIQNEPKKLAIFQEALQEIMNKTCVKFKEIFPNEKGKFPSSSWVNVTGNQKGCFSDLGRSKFRPSNLNLDVNSCFKATGHAMHEILHTLGVYHEHMRPDRNDHISILWDNIKKGNEFNFGLMSNRKVTTYGLPYDYDSIMHYSMTAFAKNRSRATIVPLKQIIPIGQRDHLSVIDIKKLLITYKCTNDSAVIKKESEYDNNPIQHYEHKKVEMKISPAEPKHADDSYDDDNDRSLDSLNTENGSSSVMDYLDYSDLVYEFFAGYLFFLR